ncbi:hypothetical protein [Streptomyces sp. cmx-18-6]|uniref:hypothetical protein n=1 Tax=Streptomyces sp. cmx-18-6 TaxID=2790930 RepID=UPI00398054F8
MSARTPAEDALAASFVSGLPGDETAYHVSRLDIDHAPDGTVTLVYRLGVKREGRPREQWEFTLPWSDKAFRDVFTSPSPSPEKLDQLVALVRALMEEWWDTKGGNRKSAKMGRRLPDGP